MGIKGLMGFAGDQRLGSRRKLSDLIAKFKEENPEVEPVLVVDGGALVGWIGASCRGWEFGGNGSLEHTRAREFVHALAELGAKLVAVFDGVATPAGREDEARRRLSDRTRDAEGVFKYIRGGTNPPENRDRESPFVLPLLTSAVVTLALKEEGATILRAEGEAEPEMARLAVQKHACAIVSSDSDFLVHSFVPLVQLPSLDEHAGTAIVYDRGVLAKHLELSDPQMPLWSCLCGNAWTRTVATKVRTQLAIEADPKLLFEGVSAWLKEAKDEAAAKLVALEVPEVANYMAQWAELHGLPPFPLVQKKEPSPAPVTPAVPEVVAAPTAAPVPAAAPSTPATPEGAAPATPEVAAPAAPAVPVPAPAPAPAPVVFVAPGPGQPTTELWKELHAAGKPVSIVYNAVTRNKFMSATAMYERSRESPHEVTLPIRKALYALTLGTGAVVKECACVRDSLKPTEADVAVAEAKTGLLEIRAADNAAKLAFVWNEILGLKDHYQVPTPETPGLELAVLSVLAYLQLRKQITSGEVRSALEYFDARLEALAKPKEKEDSWAEPPAAAPAPVAAPAPTAAPAPAAPAVEDGWTSVGAVHPTSGPKGKGAGLQSDEDKSHWAQAVHLHTLLMMTYKHVCEAYEAAAAPLPDTFCTVFDGKAFRRIYCRKGRSVALSERAKVWQAALQKVTHHAKAAAAPAAAAPAAPAPVAEAKKAPQKAKPQKKKTQGKVMGFRSSNAFGMLGEDD